MCRRIVKFHLGSPGCGGKSRSLLLLAFAPSTSASIPTLQTGVGDLPIAYTGTFRDDCCRHCGTFGFNTDIFNFVSVSASKVLVLGSPELSGKSIIRAYTENSDLHILAIYEIG